jgi:hypothetical protein
LRLDRLLADLQSLVKTAGFGGFSPRATREMRNPAKAAALPDAGGITIFTPD